MTTMYCDRAASPKENHSVKLKKAMDQPEPNLYPLRGRLGCPIFDGKSSDLTEVFGVAR
jgi:hypothetical protein